MAKLVNVAEIEKEDDEKGHCQLLLSESQADGDDSSMNSSDPGISLSSGENVNKGSPTLSHNSAGSGATKVKEESPFPGIRLHKETDGEKFFVDKAEDISAKRDKEQKEVLKREDKLKKAEGMFFSSLGSLS